MASCAASRRLKASFLYHYQPRHVETGEERHTQQGILVAWVTRGPPPSGPARQSRTNAVAMGDGWPRCGPHERIGRSWWTSISISEQRKASFVDLSSEYSGGESSVYIYLSHGQGLHDIIEGTLT